MFYENVKELCNLNGISGAEEAVAQWIIDKIKNYCDYQIDNLGNILAFKKGREAPRKKIMLAAHMDEVGFIVTGYTADGNLNFAKVGGVDDRVIIGRQVLVGSDKIPGVIGTKPVHLQSAEERKTVVDSERLYVDMGCSSKEEAESLVKLGEQICFKGDFGEFGDGCWKGKAIDDRLGCAVLIDLMGENFRFGKGNVYPGSPDRNFCFGQVHTRIDLTVVCNDETLGCKRQLYTVKVPAVFEFGHIGVRISDGSQFADLRETVFEDHRRHLRVALSAGRPSDEKKDQAENYSKACKQSGSFYFFHFFPFFDKN